MARTYRIEDCGTIWIVVADSLDEALAKWRDAVHGRDINGGARIDDPRSCQLMPDIYAVIV